MKKNKIHKCNGAIFNISLLRSSIMARNPYRSVKYRHSSVNSDMLPMVRYCILPRYGTVRYGTDV